MAARKASQGIALLRKQTTGPKVKATVTVDQVYARFQHETLYLKHPRGGRPKYLEAPMFEDFALWIEGFAFKVLDIEESAELRWGHEVGEKFKDVVHANAPVELDVLRESAGLVVKTGTKVVMVQPPVMRRLTDAELHANTELARQLGLEP